MLEEDPARINKEAARDELGCVDRRRGRKERSILLLNLAGTLRFSTSRLSLDSPKGKPTASEKTDIQSLPPRSTFKEHSKRNEQQMTWIRFEKHAKEK